MVFPFLNAASPLMAGRAATGWSSLVFNLVRLRFLPVSLLTMLCLPAAAQVVVDRGTSIAVDSREPGPLRKAADDLRSDLRKVVGAAQGRSTTIRVALNYNLPAGESRPQGTEQLRIRVLPDGVLLTGSDMRGAIYAVYEFSQRFLGVDPFWWWTDHAPPHRDAIRIPASFSLTQGPSFRYRGWFINDEDLLSGWKPGAAEKSGISLEVWDKLFEALLRLKGNIIVPGTFIFPYEPQVRAAGERGLVISQHHIEVLGLNTWRWPDDKPYSLFSHPDLLASAWRRAAEQYEPGQEVLWTLGYRGRHDRPFWSDDKDAPADDAGRAAAIQRAMDQEIGIVRKLRRNPYFLMNAWMESVQFIQKGLLKIPDGVTLVWPDSGSGIIRDEGRLAKGQGVYYHTAMLSGWHNQLTEMTPVDRIRRELARAVNAGATEYLLDNTSDVRPVVMTTRALMELAWNAQPWLAGDHDESRAFLARWSREEFGDSAAPAVEGLYRDYFAAAAKYGEREDEVLADNAYHTLARDLTLMAMRARKSVRVPPDRTAAICRDAETRWVRLDEKAHDTLKLIPPDRRDFFQGHILTPIGVHRHSNRMLLHAAEAALTRDATSRIVCWKSALQEVEQEWQALRDAEYGKWAGFYQHEQFVGLNYTRDVLRWAIDCTDKHTTTPAPPRPDGYAIIKRYQGNQRTEM
jgi:hypothetical protein